MSVLFALVSGWTGLLGPFTLKADGVALDLTGMNISLVLHKPNGTAVTPAGTVTVAPDQTTNKGQVTYQPAATDFVWTPGLGTRQDYKVHWRVVDGFGRVVYFPNGDADVISVFRA